MCLVVGCVRDSLAVCATETRWSLRQGGDVVHQDLGRKLRPAPFGWVAASGSARLSELALGRLEDAEGAPCTVRGSVDAARALHAAVGPEILADEPYFEPADLLALTMVEQRSDGVGLHLLRLGADPDLSSYDGDTRGGGLTVSWPVPVGPELAGLYRRCGTAVAAAETVGDVLLAVARLFVEVQPHAEGTMSDFLQMGVLHDGVRAYLEGPARSFLASSAAELEAAGVRVPWTPGNGAT